MLIIIISIIVVRINCSHPRVLGFSSAIEDSVLFRDNQTIAYSSISSQVRIIGIDLTDVFFTNSANKCERNSHVLSYTRFELFIDVIVVFPEEGLYFVCGCEKSDCFHQGREHVLTVISKPHSTIPLSVNIIFILTCLILSAVFSGLNLGLMSLNLIELELFEHCGSETEKAYARIIKPVRRHGNYLLSTILFGNVFVITTVTILINETIGSGYLSGIYSSLAIVILGEIVPQAICSRNALMIGAKTIWITKLFMVLTFPLSFPVSVALTWAIGENIGRGYSQEQLMALISIETNRNIDYRNKEMDIINGALQIGKKTVEYAMTYIDNVYILNYDSVLDFETLKKISSMGFTRIPIYKDIPDNIVSILNVKHLMVADPDACLPLRTICDFYAHQLLTVPENTPLDAMLKVFITAKSHMAIVRRADKASPSVVVGIITLEDIIEEIIQAEIIDETDIITDNRSRVKRVVQRGYPTQLGIISSQIQIFTPLMKAVILFLRTLEPFNENFISMAILERLVRQCLTGTNSYIFKKNQIIDCFVLIVSGKLSAIAGRDEIHFEVGPFSYFGIDALSEIKTAVQSDFDLRAIGDVHYIMITSYQYSMAIKTTCIARQARTSNNS